MNLDAVGNVAELISAVGVIATLAYLSVQIRQSSATSRANIRQQLASQQIDYLTLRFTDPELRSAIIKILENSNRDPLSDSETFALDNYAHAGLRLFESCHAQWEFGTLHEDDWRAIRRRYELMLQVGAFRENFEKNPPDIWNLRFAAMVREILGEQRGA